MKGTGGNRTGIGLAIVVVIGCAALPAVAVADEREVKGLRGVIDDSLEVVADELKATQAIAAENARACSEARAEPDPEARNEAFRAIEAVAEGNRSRLELLHARVKNETKRHGRALLKKFALNGLSAKRTREVIGAGKDVIRASNKLLDAIGDLDLSGTQATVSDCDGAAGSANRAETKFLEAQVEIRLALIDLRP